MSEIDEREIKWAIEEALDKQANVDAAVRHSHLSDQDMIDLEEMGYDDQGAYNTATFGDEFAVDTDVLVDRHWYEKLNLKPSKHVQLWSDASTKDDRRADHALIVWLQNNGYKRVDRLSGDWPGGSETEIPVDGLIEVVSKELKIDKHSVWDVLLDEFRGSMSFDSKRFGLPRSSNEYIYWTSSNGHIEMYAKPLNGEVTGKRTRQLKNKLLK